MYELVNTSLPNGLIAGTHGFATVAMTKGVPDILRGRLEALCAYTHRTSVHDATYYQQNPVNWFHVTLPQGEHVVGRVAPSDFDYTGRTNRLARLRVFSVNEMPAVGGAEILAREKHWFVQPWQGDPRYLDEDRNTCGHLRMINPARFSDAPAWNSVFGSGGLRYAQQVAWQIEKNLASGGKTIYFKTSTTWDASGEKLLGLFVDVINLLPVEMRPRVTFSTYPVSLPGGTGCSLRGIYDRDKSFDASSATQVWIDCENAKVVHAELLPTSGFDRKTETKNAFGSRDVGIGTTGQFRSDASAQRIGVRRSPSSGGDPYAYRNLIASQKKGPDMLVVGLVIAGAVVLLVAGGFFFWMMLHNKKQMQDSGATAAIEAEIKSIESETEQQECVTKEERDAEREEIKRAEKESGEEAKAKIEAERNAKARQEADEKAAEIRKRNAEREAQKAADSAAARAEREKEMKKKEMVAYLDAEKFERGCPIYDTKARDERSFLASDGSKVFYYENGVFTNEVAGFKVRKYGATTSGVLCWGPGLSRNVDGNEGVPKVRNGFVLWYSPLHKRVYIDLFRREPFAEDGEQWFAEADVVDLSKLYFGPDDNLRSLWEKATGGGTYYKIEWKYSDKYRSSEPIRTEKSKWTSMEMVAKIREKEVGNFDEEIALKKVKETNLQNDLDKKLTPDLEKLQKETNDMWKVCRAYRGVSAKIENLKSEIEKEKKKKEKEKKKKEIQECKRLQSNMLAEGSDKPEGKPQKDLKVVYENIDDLEKKIQNKAEAVDSKQKEINKKFEQIEDAKKAVKAAEQSREDFLKKFKDNIRKVRFALRVEGETIED